MKQKSIVIITSSCLPKGDANGNMALFIGDYLKQYFNVIIIYIQSQKYRNYGVNYKGMTIYSLTNARLRIAQISEEKKRTYNMPGRLFYKWIHFVMRALGRVQSLLFCIDNMLWYETKAYRLLEEINLNHKVDIVLSISDPVRSHMAAKRFKNKHSDIRWISYWLDLYATERRNRNLLISMRHLDIIERSLLSESDCILATDEVAGHLKSKIHDIHIINIPYFLKEELLNLACEREFDIQQDIHFLYAGAFYSSFRNPEYMLKVFKELPHNFHLDIYSVGDCQEIVENFQRITDGRIRSFHYVNSDQLREIILKSDILINIENDIDYSKPSKIYELLSYRKPIIDFCYCVNDADVLKKYRDSACIDMNNEIAQSVKEILDFVKIQSNLVPLTKEEMKTIYNNHIEQVVLDKYYQACQG